MHIPKRYGESKKQACPFCGKQATTQNKQGVPVCIKHKSDYLDLKCLCGEWLDIKSGKWGPYGVCVRCGNISWAKVMEANPDIGSNKEEGSGFRSDIPARSGEKAQVQARPNYKVEKQTKKETVITSDELDFYF